MFTFEGSLFFGFSGFSFYLHLLYSSFFCHYSKIIFARGFLSSFEGFFHVKFVCSSSQFLLLFLLVRCLIGTILTVSVFLGDYVVLIVNYILLIIYIHVLMLNGALECKTSKNQSVRSSYRSHIG